jgi:hypothetical protein
VLPSRAEVDVWEERWVESARQLCQWPVLREYAQEVRDAVLCIKWLLERDAHREANRSERH